MAFTKRFEEKIEVFPTNKFISVRTATIVEEDGVEIGRTYSRDGLSPGDDASGFSAQVQAIAAAVHTPEVIAAYEAQVAADEAAAAAADS